MNYVLVTGSNGMLGKCVVSELLKAGYNVLGVSIEGKASITHDNYIYKKLDLTKCIEVEELFIEYNISQVIHLAAIAHISKGMDDSWSQYYRVNTLCSKTLFICANQKNIPVFFASSIDVYGITDGELDEKSIPNPVGSYARSKWMAENILKEICLTNKYMIARFAPIYTNENKKDIRKRFYLNYPKVCYRIGKGKEYEFLSIDKVVDVILWWLKNSNNIKDTINVRDNKRFNTKELIIEEKAVGNGNVLIKIPEWAESCIKSCVDFLFKHKPILRFKAYKVINPIKTQNRKMNSYIDK